MLRALGRRVRDDRGFTLIELMLVVLIIAILITIAIPTFLGLRRGAQDRAAESSLRDGLTAAKAFYTDAGTYTGFTPGAAGTAEGIEPSLTWVAAAPAVGEVQITVVGAQEIVLNAVSASTQAFCIADSTAGGTARGRGSAADYAACDALADW